MKKLIFALSLASTAAFADDARQLVSGMPPAAQAALLAEMRDNLFALHETLNLFAAGQTREAGEMAEAKLGVSAMGKHRLLPAAARPGQYMPAEMHTFGLNGHRAASEFAAAAKAGERDKALTLLPKLTGGCVACHSSYRIR